MKAYIYARVSTEEQAEKGKSIETQIRLCRKWAKDNQYDILGEFIDEGKSATSMNRPALKDLMIKVQDKGTIDALIIQDTDRLARNTLDHLSIKTLFKKRGVKIISISQLMIDDSPEGDFIDTIIAGVNAFQSQITGRKTSKVLEEKAKLGWFPGGAPPMGYRNSDNPNPTATLDKKIITINPDTAPIIKEAYIMYATGNYNTVEIASFLNSKGIKSPMGNDIHTSLAVRMLHDKFYIGQFLWSGKSYSGKHEVFITQELYNKVQNVLAAHNQNATRKRVHSFLLRGFVFCGICGKRFWGERHTKNNGNVYNHYFCSLCREGTYVDKDILENRVADLFNKITISNEYVNTVLAKARELLEESRHNQESDRRRLTSDKSKIEKAMKEAEDSRFISHTLTEDSFSRIYLRYEQQLKLVNSELSKLGKDHSQKIHGLEKILRLAENIGNAYKDADDLLKRNYINLFFKKFIVKDGKIINYALSDEIKPLIEEGSIRVNTTGLPRVDSDHEPSSYRTPLVTKRTGLSHLRPSRKVGSGI